MPGFFIYLSARNRPEHVNPDETHGGRLLMSILLGGGWVDPDCGGQPRWLGVAFQKALWVCRVDGGQDAGTILPHCLSEAVVNPGWGQQPMPEWEYSWFYHSKNGRPKVRECKEE